MLPEEVVAKVFGVSPSEVSDDTSNSTLGKWDSFGHITLVLELEATYSLALSPDEVFNMLSVASIKQVYRSDHISRSLSPRRT